MNESILIITRDFPPYNHQVGGMIRTATLANFLFERDYDVHVIAEVQEIYNHELLKVCEGVNTHFIRTLSYWSNKIYLIRIVNYILRHVFKMYLGDATHISLLFYLKQATKIIKTFKIATVIISIPPGSLICLTRHLKKRFPGQLKIIFDYRDAWTLRRKYLVGRSDVSIKYLRNVEQKALLKGDHVLFVSEEMKRIYEENFLLPPSSVVENGYIDEQSAIIGSTVDSNDFADFINASRSKGKLIIGYFGIGSFDGSGHKDFFNLVKALLANRELAEQVSLVFQGGIQKPKYDIPDYISLKILSPAPHQAVLVNLQHIDLALFVYSEIFDAPMVMGGKLYDYIQSGKPIWILAPDNAYSLIRFTARHKKPFITDIFNQSEIAEQLTRILNIWKADSLHLYGFTKEESLGYSREAQYDKVLKILQSYQT